MFDFYITYHVIVEETDGWQKRLIHWNEITDVFDNIYKDDRRARFGGIMHYRDAVLYIKESVDEIVNQLHEQQYTLGGKH